MKGRATRKPAGKLAGAPAAKKPRVKPISEYWQAKLEQGLEDSGSCSPSHADQPTPAAATSGSRPLPPPPSGLTTVPGRQLGTTMLKSLQRRFVQQTLQTPFAAEASGSLHSGTLCEDASSCDDFVLHSSQTYERGLSQQFVFDAHNSSTQDLTQTQCPLDLAAGRPSLARPVQELQHRLSQAQAAQPSGNSGAAAAPSEDGHSGDGGGEQVLRRISNASNCSNRTTPGPPLREEDEGSCSLAAAPRLFPVFRSRKELKVLHIIRHGESEYNAASNGPRWEDPEIFDAPLTDRGRQQAAALRQQLAAMQLPSDVLWVTSPLSRAMQTLLHALPALNGGGGGAGLPNIVVRSELTEKLTTTGDVGRPASDLVRRFPVLAEQLCALPEVWWHSDPAQPNCALTKKFASRENKQQLQRRISEFKRWLQSRPEKVIVAVGHSLFWREFMRGHLGPGAAEYMKNCELQTLSI